MRQRLLPFFLSIVAVLVSAMSAVALDYDYFYFMTPGDGTVVTSTFVDLGTRQSSYKSALFAGTPGLSTQTGVQQTCRGFLTADVSGQSLGSAVAKEFTYSMNGNCQMFDSSEWDKFLLFKVVNMGTIDNPKYYLKYEGRYNTYYLTGITESGSPTAMTVANDKIVDEAKEISFKFTDGCYGNIYCDGKQLQLDEHNKLVFKDEDPTPDNKIYLFSYLKSYGNGVKVSDEPLKYGSSTSYQGVASNIHTFLVPKSVLKNNNLTVQTNFLRGFQNLTRIVSLDSDMPQGITIQQGVEDKGANLTIDNNSIAGEYHFQLIKDYYVMNLHNNNYGDIRRVNFTVKVVDDTDWTWEFRYVDPAMGTNRSADPKITIAYGSVEPDGTFTNYIFGFNNTNANIANNPTYGYLARSENGQYFIVTNTDTAAKKSVIFQPSYSLTDAEPDNELLHTQLLMSPNPILQFDAVVTGVEDIAADAAADGVVEYYNVAGQRVENPGQGLYIRRQGNEVSKVLRR